MAISIHTVFDVRFMFWISIDQEFYQGNVVKVCETIDSKKIKFSSNARNELTRKQKHRIDWQLYFYCCESASTAKNLLRTLEMGQVNIFSES